MPERSFETTAAVHDLLEVVGSLDASFLRGDRAVADDQQVLEGYKWMFSILQVALDCYVWADADNPRFVEIVGPYKKWGGDNADAYYQYAPVDPSRTYRVQGKRGDAAYLSLTVYGGPRDGRYSERLVQTVNDRDDLDIAPDGSFELRMGPERPAGWDGAFVTLDPDAVVAITRDYLDDPVRGTRCTWHIEALDPPSQWREDDTDLATRFRAAATWVKDQANMVPLGLGEPNHVDEPYPVQKVTFGWAAGDAAYAMGSYDLEPGKALVIRGRSPECAFWNLCLWNQFMHTFNYDYERCTINGSQVRYEPDGSWTIVVAHEDPNHPNWLSTCGHPRARLWFRWFYPAETPDAPTTEVVAIGDVPAGP